MTLTILLSVISAASLFLMIYAVAALIQDKRFFTSAPHDIQKAILNHSERFPGAHITGYILLGTAVILMTGSYVFAAYDGIKNDFTFTQFFIRYMVMLYSLKIFDIVFLDWYLLTKSHFYQHYYPETEECDGYHQFGFNRKSQTARLVVYPFLAFAAAYISTMI